MKCSLAMDRPLTPLARMAKPCRLPSGEDGRGRENRKSMPWRGPAGASPPPGGVYLRFRGREGEPLGVHALKFAPAIRTHKNDTFVGGAKHADAICVR